jgi:regulatory protein
MIEEYTVVNVTLNNRLSVCNVELDSSERFNFSLELVLKYKIKKGSKITKQLLQEIIANQRIIAAKQTALNFVSYKPRTEYQVVNKLQKEKFTNEEIATAVQFLKEFGYIDNFHYAQRYVLYAKTQKKSSKRKIEIDLTKRGISKDIIKKTIEETVSEDEELDNASKIARKKYETLLARNAQHSEQKLINYLLNKGFSFEVIKKVVEKLTKEH